MMPPETWAMPLVMMVMSSERVAPGRKGRMVSGASVWPMKMLAATLRDSAPETFMVHCMSQREDADDELHDAEVVEDGEERGDEDDGGQHLEGEETGVESGADFRGLRGEVAKDEGGSGEGVAEELVDAGSGGVEDALAEGPLEDHEGEEDLQAETPDDGAPADGAAVGGEDPCEEQHGE